MVESRATRAAKAAAAAAAAKEEQSKEVSEEKTKPETSSDAGDAATESNAEKKGNNDDKDDGDDKMEVDDEKGETKEAAEETNTTPEESSPQDDQQESSQVEESKKDEEESSTVNDKKDDEETNQKKDGETKEANDSDNKGESAKEGKTEEGEDNKDGEDKKEEEDAKMDADVSIKEDPKSPESAPASSAPVLVPASVPAAAKPKDSANKKTDESEELPSTPTERDVCIGDDTHKGTMLLMDLIRLHYLLIKKKKAKVDTSDDKVIDDLADRLSQLMLQGKKYELSGLKDVPKSFLKGKGRIFDAEKSILSEKDAKEAVKTIIQEQFKIHNETDTFPSSDLKDLVSRLFKNIDPASKAADDPEPHSAPRPCDVLFLPVDYPWEENMPYEHQSGNKHLLFLASQHVAADTADSAKRVEAAFQLVTSQVEVNSGTELVPKIPRYVIQQLLDNQNAWKEMECPDLAEFAAIFVFEVFLEKQIHGIGGPLSPSASQAPPYYSEHAKPSTDPVDEPTEYDVLFGRGGMTNGHPGNRRFRDIIALHRPDYIRATKMDKPNVARRIVRAIRQGNPSGRFLKKNEDDGKWYDVGDRTAAEKTSQGLRERSNAEKRQRSALREALRIRKEDLADAAATAATGSLPPSKKAKISDPSGMGQLGLSSVVPSYVGAQMNYAGGIPLSLSMKEKPKESKAKKSKKNKDEGASTDSNKESLPPNAVDKDGNILVTDYDILCGRGGLTNHHQGNKRFRDIVALHRPDYVRAPKIQKPSVARVIVRAIRNGDPPGRFLKRDEKTGKWIDIGDKKAAEKTSQALREKTNEAKEQAAAASFTSPTLVARPVATGAAGTANGTKANDSNKKETAKKSANSKSNAKTSGGASGAGNSKAKTGDADGSQKEDPDAMEDETNAANDDGKDDDEKKDEKSVVIAEV